MAKSILLVGASVRALAQSAHKAGYRIVAADLFGDADLRAVAEHMEVISPDRYPAGFENVIRRFPNTPWAYTGGLENHPALLDCLAEWGPLWGNAGAALARVRDQNSFQSLLSQQGFRFPRGARDAIEASSSDRWLVKPLRGTGGFKIREWSGEATTQEEFLQQHVAGIPRSALYLGSPYGSRLIGVTRQILASDLKSPDANEVHQEFRYVGSIGPVAVSPALEQTLTRLGELLTREAGLRGIFGVDWIEQEGECVVIEVNPRFTASVELFEQGRQSIFPHHQSCFTSVELPTIEPAPTLMSGKLILFAPEQGVLKPNFQSGAGRIADIPDNQSDFQKGEPILTLFANGVDEANTLANLKLRARDFLERYFEPRAGTDG